MRSLWRMFIDFGFLFSSLTTRKRTRQQRFSYLQIWSFPLDFSLCLKSALIQGTEDTELTLTREGDFIGSEDDNVEEINIFEGEFNRITFEQVYTKTFKCTYQLQLYPFDTQVQLWNYQNRDNFVAHFAESFILLRCALST